MEIIAFHDCDGLMAAKTYEQKYFEEYKATLNSIEPRPRPRPKIIKDVVKKEKQMLYCSTCNIYIGTTKQYEVHNKTKKHIKMALIPEISNTNILKNAHKFHCENCDFMCSNKQDYNRHLSTRKHKMMTNNDEQNSKEYRCVCGKKYKHRQGLSIHKQKCVATNIVSNNSTTTHELDAGIVIDKQTIMAILIQNQELMTKMMEIMSHS